MVCLDTSVILDRLGRGGAQRRRDVAAALDRHVLNGLKLATTRLNVAELWAGIERSRDREHELAVVESALDGLEILEFDQPSARLFGKFTSHLLGIGRPVGDVDVLIVSMAGSEWIPPSHRQSPPFRRHPGTVGGNVLRFTAPTRPAAI